MPTTPTVSMAARFFSERQAAEYLDARPQTMRAWRHRGRGPAYLKLTGRIRYRLEDLEAFIAESRVVPGERKRRRGTRRGSR